MSAITMTAVVGNDHRIVVSVPEEIPPGPVQLTINPLGTPSTTLAREEAHARLPTAGLWVADRQIPPDAVSLTDEEIQQPGHLPQGARPAEELIDKDRGPY